MSLIEKNNLGIGEEKRHPVRSINMERVKKSVPGTELISDNYDSRLFYPKLARLLCSQKTERAAALAGVSMAEFMRELGEIF